LGHFARLTIAGRKLSLQALRSLLADKGTDIVLNARIKQVSGKSGDSVSVVEQNGTEKVLNGSHVLVATGRNPNADGLGTFPPAVIRRVIDNGASVV
jgi:pyruvate/2-oxoglutarate dehydrogenase complex dihydrolipoamide dehydrogenase (E3) component